MKDTRRLKDKIDKLGAQSSGPNVKGRNIITEDGIMGLAAVLREIDETILPRKLVFETADGTISIVASNRRMISVDAVTGDSFASLSGIVGLSLTRPDVADLGRLRDSLTDALGQALEIWVKSQSLGREPPNFADGTTAAALGSAWGIDFSAGSSDAPSPVDPIASFLGAMSGVTTAWLHIEAGAPKDTSGPANLVAKLRDFSDTADMADLDVQAGDDGSRFIAIGRAPDDGDALVIVTHKANTAFVLMGAEAIENAQSQWTKSLG